MVAPGAKKPSSSRDAAAQEAMRARHEALTLVEEQFRDFDVVWAKVHGFPWWPGVLFHSWDVVRRAGIRTDPKIVASLVVPPPEKLPAEGRDHETRVRRHCLVMFLDKFNFSLVEIDPSSVAGFTAHYQAYVHAVMGSTKSKWGKKKTEFRRALAKATQLLHMGKEYVEDDLVLLEEPSPAEKKQRMDEVGLDEEEEDENASLDDAWDDREVADDAGFSLEEGSEMSAEEKKPPRKAQKKADSRKSANRKAKGLEAAEVKDVQGDDDDVVVLLPPKSRKKAPAKDSKARARKSSRKEVQSTGPVAVVSPSPSPIDLTVTPESERKKYRPASKTSDKASNRATKSRKKKSEGDAAGNGSKSKKSSRAKVLVLEDEDDEQKSSSEQDDASHQVSDEAIDITEEDEGGGEEERSRNLLLTPLSSIWTTTVSDSHNDATGSQAQLAYKQDFVWNDNVFTDELSIAEKMKAENERKQAEDAAPGRERSLGKRQSRSVQQSQIRQNLMTGNLDPHTMVQCAAYRPKDYVEDPNSRSRGAPSLDPPFQVVVHPDAVFVADLHSHLATCEIIGFLGGKWDEVSNTLYIQAAFPCRSLVIDGDDGSTDVEMDPGSEIELRGIIENAQLEVVGWYHSHPAFAPDPSVRDIENQTSYQQLFQRPCTSKDKQPSEPFVGLIVGTYDTRRSSPVSLFRYFHTRGEKVSGGACREIYMPYEFIPGRRHFKSVLQDEERDRTRMFPMYHSVLQHFKLELTSVKLPLPVDITLAPTRRSTPKVSPARVRGQGTVRKRKQSSDITGEKPIKKSRAKSRRSTRQQSASHIDLTDDNDIQNVPPAENEPAASNGVSEDKEITDSPGSTEINTADSDRLAGSKDKEAKVVPPSGCADAEGSKRDAAPGSTKPDVHNIEQEVAEVVADAVLSTENSEGKRKRSRKAHIPKRIHENLGSSGGDEQQPTDRTAAADITNGAALQESSSTMRNKVNTGRVKAVKANIDVIQYSSSSSPALSSVMKPPASPAASSGSSGRKKNRRKPQKTIKNSIRSGSPVSDGPSPGRSPSPATAPVQTFYEAFQASGPRVPNGGSQEEVAHSSSRVDGPKPDSVLVEDTQYITVEEDMKATSVSPRGDASVDAASGSKTIQRDGAINPEVQSFVISLVDKVVEKLARMATAGVESSGHEKKAVADTSSREGVNGMPNDSTDRVKPEASNTLTSEPTPDANASAVAGSKKIPSGIGSASTRTGTQLFGSNGECEDIQTSLQKMTGYLDKLKALLPSKSTEDNDKDQTDVEPESESKLAVKLEPASEREQDAYLVALRTKYGAGVSGCTEQVITLVDYYRDFERRTDLSEIWKLRITKLEKIESSLSEYVQFLNIPVALRQDFIKNLISYLRESWGLTKAD
ncbi:hypothetical protein PR001_g4807 [Phytophthora rubi]|uniref:MPN domain-containing protein n=1 Tax=Phytophthora rubi TaxID=129364 RepID=A0A6A3N9J0_9STRA|nr:hypothetical protein PR002_g5046 [Phytophthora rubi]KAE9045793.1 hypothetical protein PR001_g4807 [Phytophthora rubi]